MMPVGGDIYALYGDSIYPQSLNISSGFHNPAAGSPDAVWNTRMSKVCEVVEWGYKDIVSQWRYLDIWALMKIFEVPVSRYYTIAAFCTVFD